MWFAPTTNLTNLTSYLLLIWLFQQAPYVGVNSEQGRDAKGLWRNVCHCKVGYAYSAEAEDP